MSLQGENFIIHSIFKNTEHKGSSSHCERLCLLSVLFPYGVGVEQECKAYGILG